MDKDIQLSEIKEKSLTGVGSLFRRQLITKAIFLLGNVLLARILAPQIFGIFAIVTFVVQFFSTFGNVGLGAALIQKKEGMSREELSTVFWFQQMLVGIVAAILFFSAPLALRVYPALPSEGIWLIRAMALGFILTSLKSIPAILLERNLDFTKIARVDIAENVVFYASAVPLALTGFETWSFIIATILRSFAGTAFIYRLSPWRPSMEFHYRSVDALIKFGIPYQVNDIVNFSKDAITPLFVGAYAGNAAVGYLTWAKTFAFAPMILSEGFGRVAFPAFSRIQDDKSLLKASVELSIRSITLVMLPLTALMLALAPDITKIVFTGKWLPGIYAFYFFCTSPCIIGIMLPLYSAILSLGKSKILLKINLFLLLLEWLLGVPLVLKYGYTGVAMTQPVVGLVFYYIYMHALKEEGIRIRVLPNVKWQLVAAAVAGTAVKISSMNVEPGLAMLAFLCLFGSVLYVGLFYLFDRRTIYEFREYLWKVLVPSRG